jgi:hypothetical protein
MEDFRKSGPISLESRKTSERTEKMRPVGYEHLRQSLSLAALPPAKPAWLKPVTRIEPGDTLLSVPRSVAPDTTQPLAHLLFALKHEGVNLQILAQALPRRRPKTRPAASSRCCTRRTTALR